GDRCSTVCKILRGRGDVGIPQQAERNSPVRNGTPGIGLEHVLEGHLGCAVPERVLIDHSPVEVLLRCWQARCFEVDFAELLVVRLRKSWLGYQKSKNCRRRRRQRSFHRGSPLRPLKDGLWRYFSVPAGIVSPRCPGWRPFPYSAVTCPDGAG